jgi:hypothetical protein
MIGLTIPMLNLATHPDSQTLTKQGTRGRGKGRRGSATSVGTELLENRRASPTGTGATLGDDREARRHEGEGAAADWRKNRCSSCEKHVPVGTHKIRLYSLLHIPASGRIHAPSSTFAPSADGTTAPAISCHTNRPLRPQQF